MSAALLLLQLAHLIMCLLKWTSLSLTILREPPQCRRVWHFTQANWHGLQAAINHLDWSPIATASDINSSSLTKGSLILW